MGTRSAKRIGSHFKIIMAGILLLLAAVLAAGVFFLRKPVVKKAHISVDDATMIFQNICLNEYDSIFDNPILGKLKELHDQYGIRVTLYVYYELEEFSLADMSLDYRNEFEENADWLRIGFHSDTEEYSDLQEASIGDFMKAYARTQEAIREFAGDASITKVLRLHYWYATSNMVDFLHTQGIEGLLCSDKKEPSYDLTIEEFEKLYTSRDGTCEKNEMTYYATDIRLENTENVEAVLEEHRKDRIIVVFTHAWCFMENGDKLEEVVSALSEAGYSFDWLEGDEQ